MDVHGLEVVCFNDRYYIHYHQLRSGYEGVGAVIVGKIPGGPEEYREWLASMRAKYATLEEKLDVNVFTIDDRSRSEATSQRMLYGVYTTLPSKLPDFDGYDSENDYVINLDAEVLTMNGSLHWRLDNIPRADQLWLRAIKSSIYVGFDTISPAICPEEHMASLAIELPEPDMSLGMLNAHRCNPHQDFDDAPHKVFLATATAETVARYANEIARFGRQWHPQAFPFREIAFAMISVAAGLSSFYSLPKHTNPGTFGRGGWFDKDDVGNDKAPLLEFGSLAHLPGEVPGVAPAETMYWLEGASSATLVSLVLVVDGKAITEAMTWGVASQRGDARQGSCRHFGMIIFSLFEVALAEVSWSNDDSQPHLRVTDPIVLSPLRQDLCLSTHPRERPVHGAESDGQTQFLPHVYMRRDSYMHSGSRLRIKYPGIVAMVNFFDVLGRRRAATIATPVNTGSRRGRLPVELCSYILDYMDYTTWKSCLTVSPELRALCMSKYRLDNHAAIVAGPTRFYNIFGGDELMGFKFEDLATKKRTVVMRNWRIDCAPVLYNWMPVVGMREKRALMLDVSMQF